jgi:hypothetical protein
VRELEYVSKGVGVDDLCVCARVCCFVGLKHDTTRNAYSRAVFEKGESAPTTLKWGSEKEVPLTQA